MCFMRVDEVPRFIYFIFNRSRFPTGTSYIPLSSSGLVVRTGLSSMRLVLSGVPLLPCSVVITLEAKNVEKGTSLRRI